MRKESSQQYVLILGISTSVCCPCLKFMCEQLFSRPHGVRIYIYTYIHTYINDPLNFLRRPSTVRWLLVSVGLAFWDSRRGWGCCSFRKWRRSQLENAGNFSNMRRDFVHIYKIIQVLFQTEHNFMIFLKGEECCVWLMSLPFCFSSYKGWMF